jgi:tripartite ATP-independent transporter DctM subunit
MDTMMIGLLGIVLLLILLFAGLPVGMTMFAVGFLGYAVLLNWQGAVGILRTVFYSSASSYSLSVIPLFVLMGQFVYYSGVSGKLYETAHKWLGQLPGGLAVSTIGACGAFAAICGSSTATAATFGTVSLPEMKRYEYNPGLATGAIVAGGTLGILIPPSNGFIMYGIIAEQSIGKLFAAGIVPGIMLMFCYMGIVIIQAKRNPSLAPPSPKFTVKEKLRSLIGSFPVIILFIVVIGGIFSGVFTPNEGAGVGATGGFICLILSGKLSRKTLFSSLRDTVNTVAMIFFIVTGTKVFGYFLSITQIPSNLAKFVGSIEVSRYVVLVAILVVYVFLGMIMDALPMIMLTVPIFFPVIVTLGFDPIWYGVLMVICEEMGLITPPVGMNLYIVKGLVGDDVPLSTIIRGVLPHVIAIIVTMLLVILFPQIALLLPNLFYSS